MLKIFAARALMTVGSVVIFMWAKQNILSIIKVSGFDIRPKGEKFLELFWAARRAEIFFGAFFGRPKGGKIFLPLEEKVKTKHWQSRARTVH